ncbi:2,5-diamino-6-(ribosylamino)-4(3H)-pyrimidinone 5'-phosphate reductase [Methanospirillum hungatei]|jgi:2,5-diamino-6-(ribosylamino)-4(3H)-pyrimidinone 5'-phosphate reductase|uniref:2,5-diamino-6-(ribosylamino)-4(3H)-pyrimidinone 5'-phosphate reductase n=1 Tax=Methanospirillum hungatei TaxID=2203 RepID=UPI0009C4AE78|nr:2,5-diamino-6-(ribosylamino)-4(3H)-pyrimidinone 5'-phosphate reductase [Methanospirillum hungatei]MBP9008340.1 2,5-diamino-6-(ribosylamino)-4(3H)-pyrimidinone 5'-phosphate reductase [Methanospirillum sp.]OQA59823.1 MAG: 2,5-diamino-6-ribosylamino-4(3H)-pyrimidinone 5'-phosphate reductase [Euryarchaeota archaeon ADurb.Bin294]HOW05541.1 2,5-diamino-6-(ribosylamino)-4(3H)-pyrimidinone 5'-phosphate reductase [Methanospirillum hungatei]
MRPYVIVNVAVSADGKLSTRERRQVKISGKEDFDRVDEIKAGCDAIMVGIGTVLADDPSLTIKSANRIAERVRNEKPEHPVRIVVDSQARTPPDAKILHKGSGLRIIAVSLAAPEENISALKNHAEIIQAGEVTVDLPVLLTKLAEKGIKRLMVEGGGTLIWGMLSAGLVDELTMFVGNIIIGGKDAPTLADGTGYVLESDFPVLERMDVIPMEEGVLIHWKVRK